VGVALVGMRVLQVDKFLRRFGGAAGYMLDIAEGQRAQGHDVEFFSMQHPDNLPATYERFFPPLVRFDDDLGGMRDKAIAATTMIWSTKAQRGMRQVIEAFRPDVIHVHNIYHQLSPSILRAAKAAKVPVVMTVHDYKLVCPIYEMTRNGEVCTDCVAGGLHHALKNRCQNNSLLASGLVTLESSLHRSAKAYSPISRFIVPSRFLGSMLTEAGVFPDRVQVIPHGMATYPDDVASQRDGSLLFAGRLSSGKGVDILIQAMAKLPGVKLNILGDGPERATLERLAVQVAPGQVVFHGHQSKEAVLQAYRTASIGVLSARWFENQPMSLLEGMALGLPFVASDLGGIPELVQPGVSGELVEPGNPAALVAAIDKLLSDPATLERYRSQCAAFVVAHHDFPRHLEVLENVYREVQLP
jgi:glycosyltransferase involved in cell wall biosynthesis